MASRTLPNLALKGFWLLGEDGWKTENDLNLLKLSVLTQGGAISKVAATPGAPTDGDVHIFDETHPTQPNAVAIRDDGAWVYVTPSEGWLVYNRAANYFEVFDGTVWAELATGGGGGGATAIDDLTDVDTTTTAPSVGDVLEWDGSNWVPAAPSGGGGGGGVSPFWASDPTPPVVADFGVPAYGTNVGTAILSDTGRGVLFGTYPTAINLMAIQLLPLAHPGGSWTMDMLLHHSGRFRDHRSIGLYVRNTTSGKITTFAVGHSGAPYYLIQNYNDINTFNATAYALDDRGAMVTPIWLRLKYISTGTPRFEFWASRDGEQYYYIESYNVSSYVVSFDQVGVFYNGLNNGVAGVNGAGTALLMSADIY